MDTPNAHSASRPMVQIAVVGSSILALSILSCSVYAFVWTRSELQGLRMQLDAQRKAALDADKFYRDEVSTLGAQVRSLKDPIKALADRVDAVERNEARLELAQHYYPSGWMGDGAEGMGHLQFKIWHRTSHSAPYSVKVTYTPGALKWAGIYLQNKPNNWGDRAGDDLREHGYKRLVLWARGELGGERVEFKAGGISKSYSEFRDSFEATSGSLELTREWRRYEVSLEKQDLSSVLGAFAFVVAGKADGSATTFYMDDMCYEK